MTSACAERSVGFEVLDTLLNHAAATSRGGLRSVYNRASLMEQMRQNHADYLMISGSHKFPGILQLSPILQRSNAFELAHVEPAQRSSSKRGVVLLKRTGEEPKTLSTQMTTESLTGIRRCERAQGPGVNERMQSTFPNGIVTLTNPTPRKG